MANQKQINLQVLLLMTGVFFTALSAAKACFVPYLSIYLRQLGLTSGHVGIIIGIQNLLVATTASCVGRFLIGFKSARVFLLLAITLYLGGVLTLTIIPPSNKAVFKMYCGGFSNSSDLPNVKGAGEIPQQNGSVMESMKPKTNPTQAAVYSEYPQSTVKIEVSSYKPEIQISTLPSMLVSESAHASVNRLPQNQREKTEANMEEFQTDSKVDDTVRAGSVFDSRNKKMLHHGAQKIAMQAPSPTAGSSARSHHWSGDDRPHRSRPEESFLSNKWSRGQQPRREQSRGQYQKPEESNPGWKWNDERGMDYGAGHYRPWDWDNGQQPQQGVDAVEDDGIKEDVLDWLLGRGREPPEYDDEKYLRHRVKRSDSYQQGHEESKAQSSTERPREEITSARSNTSVGGDSTTFWVALLLVGLTGAFAGPVEQMCDTALYHQLDSIDELDKYKRPTLLTMPIFAVMGLASALIVDSTACFLKGNSSHMLIHFYLSAACIGVVFLIGIVVPLSHKVKKQQEGKYIKSIKFLYSDSHTAVMCLTLVVSAMISSCSDTFLFWLIQDMHGLETTMGVSLAIAYMTELPMSIIFTPWLVQKLGNIWLLALGTACLGVQNLYYSVLWTPWAVVPIQVLHALGRSAIRGCILAFLNEASPPGMGKAIQVTVLALEQGFGYTIGSMMWGFVYSALAAKLIFVAAAVLALVWTVVLIICACRLPTKKRFMYAKLLQSDMEMEMKGGGFGSDSEDNEEKEWLQDGTRDEDEVVSPLQR